MRSYRCATNGRFCPPVSSQGIDPNHWCFQGTTTRPFLAQVPALGERNPELCGQGLDRCRSRSERDNPTRILTGVELDP
jgi:hypothetical protein